MAKKEDPQVTGMAGEFLTVGKLFKRRLQASVTFGNAKGVDILVYNEETDNSFVVQVKTLRYKNCFPMHREAVKTDHVYIFIILGAFEDGEEFFVVPGHEILKDIDHFFGSSYKNPQKPSPMPAINYGPLKPYRENWAVFDRAKSFAAAGGI